MNPESACAEQNLYEAGEEGYAQFRIPCLLCAGGALLAVCEARRSCDDWAVIDLLLRRSRDGGRSWGPPEVLAEGTARGLTVHNPVLIDAGGGAVHFLYGIGYARVFYRRSDDAGRTWSPAREITGVFGGFRSACPWKVAAVGPGHGIRLRGGRLLVPVWLSDASGWRHGPSQVATIYSDDGGAAWRSGELLPPAEDVFSPSEAQAAELDDGRVLLALRTHNIARPREELRRRAFAVSEDGAGGWSLPRLDPALPDPSCCASLLRLPGAAGEASRYLFCNPASTVRRERLTVRMSADGGRSFGAGRVLCASGAAYSDLAAGNDGEIYCLYEKSDRGRPYRDLTFARFTPEWLEAAGENGEKENVK